MVMHMCVRDIDFDSVSTLFPLLPSVAFFLFHRTNNKCRNQMHDEINKVKPVYKCQSREPENVAFMSNCQYLWSFLFLIAPSLFSNVYIQVENYMHYPLIEIMRLPFIEVPFKACLTVKCLL